MTNSAFRKRFYWTAASIGAVYAALVFAFVKGLVSPRPLAWVFIAIGVAGYIAFYCLLKRARDERRASGEFDKPLDEQTRLRYRSSIRHLKIMVFVLIFSLVYGLWSTRGDSLPPSDRRCHRQYPAEHLFHLVDSQTAVSAQ